MQNKIVSFQILRAFAIALIFLSHCEYLARIRNANAIMYWGALGVSLFIALGGFLAARKYRDLRNSLSPIALYMSRWKKFCKCHYLTMIFAIPFTYGLLASNPIKWFVSFLSNLTLTQAIIPLKSVYFSFNAVSWYLSLILVFALLTPVAVFVWNRLSLKMFVLALVLIVFFEFLLIVLCGRLGIVHWLVYISPVTRFLDFIIGGGAYKVAERIREKRLNRLNCMLFVVSCSLLIGLLFMSCFCGNNLFLTAVWTGPSTLLVMTLYNIIVAESSLIKILVGFGNISFEFFLVHHLVLRLFTMVAEKVHVQYWLAYVVSFIFACVVALVLHGRPFTKQK